MSHVRIFAVGLLITFMFSATRAFGEDCIGLGTCNALAGLPPVLVTVFLTDDSLSPDKRSDIEIALRERAERELRTAGVALTDSYRKGAPSITFSILCVGQACAFESTVSEDVTLRRNSQAVVSGTLWQLLALARVSPRSTKTLGAQLAEQVKVFAHDLYVASH